VFRKKIIRKFI